MKAALAAAEGSKEPVSGLADLQGNANVVLHEAQLAVFSRLTDLPAATINALILRLRTNAGSIHGESAGGNPGGDPGDGDKIGCALSTTLAALNHSCAPSAAVTITAGHVVVSTLRPVSPGEELTISYVDAAMPVAERRSILKRHYSFECDCARCAAELKETAGGV